MPSVSGQRRPGLFDEAPFILFWETTRACDLVCRHCRACAVPDRSPAELSTDEGRRLLDDAADMGVPLVVLTGGDPAKRPDLVDLVRHGTARGLRMALTPSATPLVTADLLRRLRDAGLARLAVSLDADAPAVHDGFRGVAGSHARTHEILEAARALGLTTQVNTSVTRANLDELPALAHTVGVLGVELWSVFVVVPTGRATALAALDADEIETLLDRLADLRDRVGFDIKTTAAPHFCRVLLQRRVRGTKVVGIRDGIGRRARGVNDGSGVVFVSHVGDVCPSGFLPVACGNVRQEGLAAVYRRSPLFLALRDPDRFGGKCGRCEFRMVCGGSRARAFAATGDPLAEDPGCTWTPRRRAHA